MKIVVVSRQGWPHQGPRAFRTAELVEELARLGHDVTLYSVHREADYKSYMQKTGVTMKPLVMQIPMNNDGQGFRYNSLDRVIYHTFKKIADYPLYEFKYRVSDALSKEEGIDLLITIAVPHEIHFGAALSKRKNPKSFAKCWIADCGDPFMFNPYSKPLFYFAREEKRWCKEVDYITVPTEQSKDGYYPEFRDKIRVIPQGFDFSKTPVSRYKPNPIPIFAYAGQFYDGLRDPSQFLDYLATLKADFKCVFFTKSDVPQKYHDMLGEKLIVNLNWKRPDIIFELGKMDFLLNIPNKGSKVQVPSKLIDYAIAKRPVLSIDTDFAQEKQFQSFFRGDYDDKMNLPDLDTYDIRNIARQFIELANNKIRK